MRKHGGADPDERELGERGLFGRAPRFVPRLIPAPQLARVAMSAFRVRYLDVACDHGGDRLELFADLAKRGRLETELGLHIVDLRRAGRLEMPHQTRAVVPRGIGFRERGARERIDRAERGLMAEDQLAAMHLERDHSGTLGELPAPAVPRLRRRTEARRSL